MRPASNFTTPHYATTITPPEIRKLWWRIICLYLGNNFSRVQSVMKPHALFCNAPWTKTYQTRIGTRTNPTQLYSLSIQRNHQERRNADLPKPASMLTSPALPPFTQTSNSGVCTVKGRVCFVLHLQTSKYSRQDKL